MASSKAVPTPLLQPYPLRSGAQRPQLVEDLLALAKGGKQAAVDEIVNMLADLHQEGRECRHIKSLKGLPLFELKSASRGGHRGGARAYFTFTEENEALVFNVEARAQDVNAPDPAEIKQALAMLAAYKSGTLRIAVNSTSQKRWRP